MVLVIKLNHRVADRNVLVSSVCPLSLSRALKRIKSVAMHGYPVMQVVQYSVPPCSWASPADMYRTPTFGKQTFVIVTFGGCVAAATGFSLSGIPKRMLGIKLSLGGRNTSSI